MELVPLRSRTGKDQSEGEAGEGAGRTVSPLMYRVKGLLVSARKR
jgi:hypothetical protein